MDSSDDSFSSEEMDQGDDDYDGSDSSQDHRRGKRDRKRGYHRRGYPRWKERTVSGYDGGGVSLYLLHVHKVCHSGARASDEIMHSHATASKKQSPYIA